MPVLMGDQAANAVLAELDQQITLVVLNRQDPITGLLPASTANTVHGNYGDACILAQADELSVHLLLLGDPVVLEFEVKIVLTQEVLVLESGLFRVLVAVAVQERGDLAAQAR